MAGLAKGQEFLPTRSGEKARVTEPGAEGLGCHGSALAQPNSRLGCDSCLGPTHGSYLRDFALLLHGSADLNEQAVLGRMALSFGRVMSDGCHPAVRHCLHDAVQAEAIRDLPFDMMDGLSDKYCLYMMGPLQHEDALEKTWREFGSRVDRHNDARDDGWTVV